MGLERRPHRVPYEGFPPGEPFVKDAADGVQVGPRVNHLAPDLFGGHVLGGPGDQPVGVEDLAASIIESGRQAEVEQHRRLIGTDDDVVGLQVAVDHPLAVEILQRMAETDHDPEERLELLPHEPGPDRSTGRGRAVPPAQGQGEPVIGLGQGGIGIDDAGEVRGCWNQVSRLGGAALDLGRFRELRGRAEAAGRPDPIVDHGEEFGEGRPADPIHHVPRLPVFLPGRDDPHEARVANPRQGLDLTADPVQQDLLADPHRLQRDLVAALLVDRPVDDAHTALTEDPRHPVTSKRVRTGGGPPPVVGFAAPPSRPGGFRCLPGEPVEDPVDLGVNFAKRSR